MIAYILTRLDLNDRQRFVQATHALVGLCIKNPEKAKEWNNSNLVILGIKGKKELAFWMQEINSSLKKNHNDQCDLLYDSFYEPWYKENTAVAVFDIDGQISTLLKDLPLV